MKWRVPILDWQHDFLTSTKKVKALSGAADTGKSWICRFHQILSCLRYARSEHFASATTYQQAYRAIIEPMIRDLSALGYGDRIKYNHQDKILYFFNGSRIEVYGAEKLYHKIKSREVFSCFIEEATTIDDKYTEEFFGEVLRRLRQPGFEKLNKPLLLATNPDIKSRWLYENIFGAPPDHAFVKQLAFLQGFHRNDEERAQNILIQSKRQIDLYYWGLWGALEGQAFFVEPEAFDESQLEQYYISFDYGFQPDPMVYLLHSIKNGVIFIVDEIVLPGVTVNRHKSYLERWMDKNIVGYTGDTSPGSAEVRDVLTSLGITYYPTVKDRSIGWTTLADLIDLGRYKVHPRCKLTLRSLGSMCWVGSTIGVDCEGEYDDEADASRYFVMCPFIFNKLGLRMTKPGKITVR